MTDIFRVDYYPHRAHAKFMGLKGDEIALLIQIINLIYMNGGPVANDGRYLSQSVYDFGTAKCNRIVKILLEKGHLYENSDGFLGQKMSETQLNIVRDRSETRAKSGALGGQNKANNQNEKKKFSPSFDPPPIGNELKKPENFPIAQTENELNQQLSSSNSTSTNTSTSITPYSPPGGDINSLNFFQLKRIIENEKPKSKRYKLAYAKYHGMLNAGYDPRAEIEKPENQHDLGSDKSEL